ncbi:MAG: hypothetical protein ACFCAD_09515 [Pleurocapsa sp.]
MNPNNWFVVCFFIIVATLLTLAFGLLAKQKRSPIESTLNFNRQQWQFLKIWLQLSLLLGIIIPIVLLAVYWTVPIVRQFLSVYLLTVGIQLASEKVFSRRLCKSSVVAVGLLYTGFRLWQMGSGLQLINYGQPWFSLLWLVFLFWVTNMVMLTTFAIPIILSESADTEQSVS